jgi:hypothetical protein
MSRAEATEKAPIPQARPRGRALVDRTSGVGKYYAVVYVVHDGNCGGLGHNMKVGRAPVWRPLES